MLGVRGITSNHLEDAGGERNLGGRRGGERRNHLEDARVEEAAGGDPEEGARDVVVEPGPGVTIIGVLGCLLDLPSRRRNGW